MERLCDVGHHVLGGNKLQVNYPPETLTLTAIQNI